jgi:hypothetical protein
MEKFLKKVEKIAHKVEDIVRKNGPMIKALKNLIKMY